MTNLELDVQLINEAISMTEQGASHKDLYTNLFVPKADFNSWFLHGRDLVNEGYGRISDKDLAILSQSDNNFELEEFDVMCLLLYRGIILKRWEIKRELHKLVAQSQQPQMAFKYLEAVWRTDFNPRFAEEQEDELKDESDESATSFIMDEFYANQKEKTEKNSKYQDEDSAFNTDTNERVAEAQES